MQREASALQVARELPGVLVALAESVDFARVGFSDVEETDTRGHDAISGCAGHGRVTRNVTCLSTEFGVFVHIRVPVMRDEGLGHT